MPNARIRFTPPRIYTEVKNDADNYVNINLPARVSEVECDKWFHLKAVLTATFGYCSVVDGVYGGGTFEQDGNTVGETALTKAFKFYVMAEKVAAGTALLNNTVVIYAGSAEVGRIFVDASTGKISEFYFDGGDAESGDTRFQALGENSQVTGGAIEADDNIYTKASHGFTTGQRLQLSTLTGGTGLTAGNTYWFHKLSANTGYLCATLADAIAGTAINVTLDATSVVINTATDIGISLTQVDSNLRVHLFFAGSAV
jgi:hypothetical protein